VGERIRFSEQQLTLDDVQAFYQEARVSIEQFLSQSSDALVARDEPECIATNLQGVLEELDHLSALSAMASLEATLRLNYLRRVYRRLRDPLSRAMRLLHHQKAHRARLEGDLIRLWRDEAHVREALLRGIARAFEYRHWLAHGRYWTLKLGYDHDFLTVLEIAGEFIAAMQDYDAKFCRDIPRSARERQRNRSP
jgi:hypothetical protein